MNNTVFIDNVKTRSAADGAIYVGRANREYGLRQSPLANPFPLERESQRVEKMAEYKRWLWDRIRRNDPATMRELRRIVQLSQCGHVTLVCWCAPKLCHAMIVASAVRMLARKWGLMVPMVYSIRGKQNDGKNVVSSIQGRGRNGTIGREEAATTAAQTLYDRD